MITVVRYTPELRNDLEHFVEEIKQYDLFNWSSIERLKTDKITYFMAYYHNKIISINGCYNYKDTDWILFTRQFTIPKYFKLIKRSGSKIWASMSIPTRFLALPSLQYALDKGAKSMFYCINVSADNIGWKDGLFPLRHAEQMIKSDIISYAGVHDINSVPQHVFRVHIKNMIVFLNKIANLPLRLNDEIT